MYLSACIYIYIYVYICICEVVGEGVPSGGTARSPLIFDAGRRALPQNFLARAPSLGQFLGLITHWCIGLPDFPHKGNGGNVVGTSMQSHWQALWRKSVFSELLFSCSCTPWRHPLGVEDFAIVSLASHPGIEQVVVQHDVHPGDVGTITLFPLFLSFPSPALLSFPSGVFPLAFMSADVEVVPQIFGSLGSCNSSTLPL